MLANVEQLNGPGGRLVRTYLILIGKATRRETATYREIAEANAVAMPGVGGLCLDPVADWCKARRFPDLTVLVVSEETGQPAEDHVSPTLYRVREGVYRWPWTDYAPPTVDGV